MLDGIGPVLTLMMPSSLNLESLLLCWRPYIGMGVYGDAHHPSDHLKIISMVGVQSPFLGLDS